MNQFVIIFKQGPVTLTDSDRQNLREATAPWARKVNEDGHQLEPRILAPERETLGDTETVTGAWPITALLFLAARDLQEAAAVAGSHPAMRYQFQVEVRPWAAPAPAAAARQ
ncbi:MAG: hypothetical protein QM757_26980 [Paludibaculum sp.]